MRELKCEACNEKLEPYFNRSDGQPVYRFLLEYPVCNRKEDWEEVADEHYPYLRDEFNTYLKTEGLKREEVTFGDWLEDEALVLRVPGYFEGEYVEAF